MLASVPKDMDSYHVLTFRGDGNHLGSKSVGPNNHPPLRRDNKLSGRVLFVSLEPLPGHSPRVTTFDAAGRVP